MRVLALRGAVFLGALGVWEAVARPLNPILYVAPSALPGALLQVLRGEDMPPFVPHLLVTLQEIGATYALAVAGGIWVGFLLGLRPLLGRIYEPILSALYAIPSVVWYPSLMLFFGLGPASKIAFGFLLGFFPIVLAVLAGVRQADRHLITVATSMGAGPWTIFWKVVLPGMTSTLASGLRGGLALSVVGVLVGEVLGARGGVGYVLNYVYGLLRTPEYVALVVLVAAVVLGIDGAAGLLEGRAKRWAG